MKRVVTTVLVLASATSFGLAACSQETQDDAQLAAERAAADTAENAEVVQEVAEDAAIVAADEISEGAASLRDEMADDEAAQAPTDGQLDGTD